MDYDKLFEVAGMQDHYKKEKKVFEDTMMGLRKFMNFVDNYGGDQYHELYREADNLIEAMKDHLQRYRK